MAKKITEALESWLTGGTAQVGEIRICRQDKQYQLTHYADAERSDLTDFTKPEDARMVALYDDMGKYRPLKSAPNLKHGWKLTVKNLAELHSALDYFYPAMLGTLFAYKTNKLRTINFRETAHRQSGMYELVKNISNSSADTLIGNFCKSDGKCLKVILWKLDANVQITTLPASKFDPSSNQLNSGKSCKKMIPLLCSESCHLLISAARNVVRQSEV